MKKLVLFFVFLFALLALPANAQTAHSVTLTWTASTSACVATVNIHRSTTPGGEIPVGMPGSNYAVIPVGMTIFVDNAVTAGQTYYYTASSYGSNCDTSGTTNDESLMSNEAKVTVPSDKPAPPTNVTAVSQ